MERRYKCQEEMEKDRRGQGMVPVCLTVEAWERVKDANADRWAGLAWEPAVTACAQAAERPSLISAACPVLNQNVLHVELQ